jgi:hypothetical protein
MEYGALHFDGMIVLKLFLKIRCEGTDWTNLAHDKGQRWAVMNW